MRAFALCVFAAAVFATGVAASAQTVLIGQSDTALPGGVYTSLNAPNAAACAQLCAEDGICMAWTLQPTGVCELKAVVPKPVAAPGAISGASRRAPDFARALAAAEAPEPQAAPPPAPAAPARTLRADSSGLLGGPTPDTDLELRTRFAESASP